MRSTAIATLVTFAASLAATAAPARAEWVPPGMHATTQTLAGVLRAHDAATGVASTAHARRHERWTYRAGGRDVPVAVAVRDDDYRVRVRLGATEYDAGRLRGTRWRGDGNGIVHRLRADQQGDALDRLPQSAFPFERGALSIAGETAKPEAAWVLADRRPGEPTTWVYVDETTGLVTREVTREGKRVHTIAFDRYGIVDGVRVAQRWTIADGDPAHDVAVEVAAVEPGTVDADEVALPTERRTFAAPAGTPDPVDLSARFTSADVEVDVDGTRRSFVLDTGTTSVTVDAGTAARFDPFLEHATIPRISAGPFALREGSVLAVPIFGGAFAGLLGYDFFFGHVVRIDYLHRRVAVYSDAAAAPIFADPATTIVPAIVGDGLPFVPVTVAGLASDAFAVDTGSSNVVALAPFAQRYAREIAAWPAAGRRHRTDYLEGAVVTEPHRVATLAFGPFAFADAVVGVEVPDGVPDAIESPFDGIVGSDVLSLFDL